MSTNLVESMQANREREDLISAVRSLGEVIIGLRGKVAALRGELAGTRESLHVALRKGEAAEAKAAGLAVQIRQSRIVRKVDG